MDIIPVKKFEFDNRLTAEEMDMCITPISISLDEKVGMDVYEIFLKF